MSAKDGLTIVPLGGVVLMLVASCGRFAPQAPTMLPPTATSWVPTPTGTACPETETPPDEGGPILGTPVSEWNGIPVMPEAAAGREQCDAYVFALRIPPAEVADFYMQEIPKLGYEAMPGNATPELGFYYLLLFRKGTEPLVITIMPHAGATEVTIRK